MDYNYLKDLIKEEKYTRFMRESNHIEGEDGLNPHDLEAVRFALKRIKTITDILELHRILTQHLNVSWSGKFRQIDIYIGQKEMPKYYHVNELMAQFVKQIKTFDSWEAHNRFEAIHPFEDFNGRTGRLIWLSKAVNEGYKFDLPFLHKYYYQTLSRQTKA